MTTEVKRPMVADITTGQPVDAFLGGDPVEPVEYAAAADRGDVVTESQPAPAPTPAPNKEEETPPAEAAEEQEEEEEVETPPAEAADDAQEEEPKQPTDDRWVNRERFNEVNEERKELRDQVKQLTELVDKLVKSPKDSADHKPEPEVPAFDFASKEKEYAELVLDGKTAEAAELRAEINGELIKQATLAATKSAASNASQQMSQQTAQEKIDAHAETIAQQYEAFDDASAGFNREYVEEVQMLFKGYVGKLGAVEAFKKAVDTVIKVNNLQPKQAKPAEPAPTTPAPKKKQTAQQKERTEAAKGAPKPTVSGQSGVDGGLPSAADNVLSMSQEQFDALPELTKKQLRGDFVA